MDYVLSNSVCNLRKPIRVTSCRFQVVASKLSLPSCRFQVVASKLSLPSCRFRVVASELSLPSCRFREENGSRHLSCYLVVLGLGRSFSSSSFVDVDKHLCSIFIQCQWTFSFGSLRSPISFALFPTKEPGTRLAVRRQ